MRKNAAIVLNMIDEAIILFLGVSFLGQVYYHVAKTLKFFFPPS